MISIVFAFLSYPIFAQNVGIGTATPNTNAVLVINGANQRLLIPRGNATVRNSLNTNAPKGLMMLDTVTNTIWVNNGNGLSTGWLEISNSRVGFFAYATTVQI